MSNEPETLRRDTWPPNPATMPRDETSFHLYLANSHMHTASGATDDFNEAIDAGDLATAIESADRLFGEWETVVAELVRYAVTSGAMTEREVANTCDVLTAGRIKTIVKDASERWNKVQPTLAAFDAAVADNQP